jgi:hypothetical protein
MARGTAPSALLARHYKGEGSPVTALCIVCGGVAAAAQWRSNDGGEGGDRGGKLCDLENAARRQRTGKRI